jgi:hydroxymethylpyrimidine/phosphomethylpyrimidine kinase
MPRRPRVLCVGGLDPTGRAGLLADAWAVRTAGAEPLCVATALTAQGGRAFSLNPVAVKVLEAQLDAAFRSGPVGAVKLGMIADRAQLRAIIRALRSAGVRHLVVDPVISTSRGEPLSRLLPDDYAELAPLHPWLTPNRPELAWLGMRPETLLERGFRGVLVKGSDSGIDHLLRRSGSRVFRSRPVKRDPVNHRGTGCRLASALAARLALKDTPELAVRRARGYVLRFLSTPIIRAR